MYDYEIINGARVEVNVARDFRPLAAAFKAETGYELLVTRGACTRREQMDLFDGWTARKPGFNLAVHPDSPYAYHVETNPSGPRALDLRDSGKDAGVTVVGTKRSNVLVRLAPLYGFENAGHYFKPVEGWHYLYTRPIGGAAPAKPAPAATASPKRNPFGIPTAIGLQKIARLYGYKGKNDDIWGAGSGAGFAQFLRANWGYVGNDVLGPIMWAAIARWLRKRWGYVGNDVPGPVMRAALRRAESANRAAFK